MLAARCDFILVLGGIVGVEGHAESRSRAVGLMMVTVAGYSLYPVIVVLAGTDAPFLFNAGARFGLMVFNAALLPIIWWRLLTDPVVWSIIRRRLVSWSILFTAAGHFPYGLLALSMRLVDASVAAIAVEFWPVFAMAIGTLVLGDSYRGLGSRWGLVAVCLVGLVWVVASETGHGFWEFGFGVEFWRLAGGVLLALAAAFVLGMMVFSWRWGQDVSAEIGEVTSVNLGGGWSVDLFCVTVAVLIANVIALPVGLVVGFALGESAQLDGRFALIAVVGGALNAGVSNLCWRAANYYSRDFVVNALSYLSPAVSLVVLFLMGYVHIVRWDFLVVGAATIITGNLLMNLRLEFRRAFRSLLLALGVSGALVYMRDEWMPVLLGTRWQWTGSGYFEALSLSATVFTLLLAFRVARLVSRTREEEALLLGLFRRLEDLESADVVACGAREQLLEMDSAERDENLERAYLEVCRLLSDGCPVSEADRRSLSEAQVDLDALARSKRTGLVAGEAFALYVFAGITVGLALFSGPGLLTGWSRVLVDLFAVLVSSVVVFLAVHVSDLQQERRVPKLELWDALGRYAVSFTDGDGKGSDMLWSVGLGIAVIAVYIALLGYKWMGWFTFQ